MTNDYANALQGSVESAPATVKRLQHSNQSYVQRSLTACLQVSALPNLLASPASLVPAFTRSVTGGAELEKMTAITYVPAAGIRVSEWWRFEGFPSAVEWQAFWGFGTFGVALVAAIIALSQLQAHHGAERARRRPYVIVDFSFRSILMDIEIKNIGESAAGNLTLKVNIPFKSGIPKQAERLNRVFSSDEKISMLAPGRRILYSFDRAPDYYKAKHPEIYTVTACYTDAPILYQRRWQDWWRRTEIRYEDTLTLDFRQWSQANAESNYDNKNWNIASRQEKRTEKILQALNSIADGIHTKTENSPVPYWPISGSEVVEVTELTSDTAFELPVKPEPAETNDVDDRESD